MRSRTAEVTAFGVVVRIEQDSTHCPLGVFPAIPQSCEREQLAFVDFEKLRLPCFRRPLRLVETIGGDQHLRNFSASRNAGLVLAVSDLALSIRAATEASFAHDGMRRDSPLVKMRYWY
jgi:hypothetical protein